MRARPGDRRGAAFAAVVVALAAVGIYLAAWPPSQERPEREAWATAVSAPTPSNAPPTRAGPVPFDVYSYLPMRKEQLAATAELAERFATVYGTFRYDEDAAAHVGRVTAYTTSELGAALAREITSARRIAQNRDGQVVSAATGQLKQIRRIAKHSVVFVVTVTRRLTTKRGDERLTQELAVTVSRFGADWRVFDVQPAAEGQDGDCPFPDSTQPDPCHEQRG